MDQGFHSVKLSVNGSEGENTHWLVPMVTYSGVKNPIRLGDSMQVSFTIDQKTANPVIQLDQSGFIRALRVGEATITADFAGARDQIAVVVRAN